MWRKSVSCINAFISHVPMGEYFYAVNSYKRYDEKLVKSKHFRILNI